LASSDPWNQAWIDTSLDLCNIRISTLNQLELNGTKSLELLQKAQFLFPNLSSLIFYSVLYDYDEFCKYFSMVCNGWKLKKLRVVQQFHVNVVLKWFQDISIEGM
jgi:hypothetical protein